MYRLIGDFSNQFVYLITLGAKLVHKLTIANLLHVILESGISNSLVLIPELSTLIAVNDEYLLNTKSS